MRRLLSLLLIAAGCSRSGAFPKPSRFGTASGGTAHLVVGPAGGTVVSADAILTLTVPAGAVAADTDFTITPVTNTAPGGQGSGYRLAPEGVALFAPITLTFQIGGLSVPIDQLSVAYQDSSAYWLRVPTSRDPVGNTISANSLHLSDWSVTTSGSPRDLFGTITYSSTVDIPFSANGTGILNYAGEDAAEAYYLAGGSLTVPATITVGSATCTVAAPTVTQRTSVAELFMSPPNFFYAMNAIWQLQCSDGTSPMLATAFDSEGIALFRCPRAYVGTPLISTSHLQGTVTIDCGTDGQVTGSWDLAQ